MDDFILIHRDKRYLQYCLEEINKVCNEELNLELNQKTQIGIAYNGIDFLGFNYILTGSGKAIRKLRFSSKQRMRKYIKTMKELKNKSIINEEYINMRINSFKAHLKYCQKINHKFHYRAPRKIKIFRVLRPGTSKTRLVEKQVFHKSIFLEVPLIRNSLISL